LDESKETEDRRKGDGRRIGKDAGARLRYKFVTKKGKREKGGWKNT